ncbi:MULTISPECIES: hypothetical protein [Streptomyces]|uniref:hypothetical protein n=1 Tax=Streptomyces TaxID=1883 RepID=UPI00186B3F03|nr:MULTISPECIES: hypothetical protein [Streptomyces]
MKHWVSVLVCGRVMSSPVWPVLVIDFSQRAGALPSPVLGKLCSKAQESTFCSASPTRA